jgi:AbiV family abortive infection protein
MERKQYLQIYENGINHINTATSLATLGHYGFACSHLVLGMEELIKYQVVMNNSSIEEGIDAKSHELFDDKEVNPNHRKSVFRDHSTKHELIKEFQEASSPEFMNNHIDYVFHLATGQDLKEEHLETRRNRFKQFGSFLGGAYQEICIPQTERAIFSKWLNEANTLKNRGFYVDSKNGNVETPSEITEQEYILAFRFVDTIRKQTEVLKDLDITDDEFDDFMNSPIGSDDDDRDDN